MTLFFGFSIVEMNGRRGKKTCLYGDCDIPAEYDDKKCVFHSRDKTKDGFIDALKQENKKIIYVGTCLYDGYIFPK